ncbi:hypothetical protein GZH46_01469, partial [Fragariocoptes setiger]
MFNSNIIVMWPQQTTTTTISDSITFSSAARNYSTQQLRGSSLVTQAHNGNKQINIMTMQRNNIKTKVICNGSGNEMLLVYYYSWVVVIVFSMMMVPRTSALLLSSRDNIGASNSHALHPSDGGPLECYSCSYFDNRACRWLTPPPMANSVGSNNNAGANSDSTGLKAHSTSVTTNTGGMLSAAPQQQLHHDTDI